MNRSATKFEGMTLLLLERRDDGDYAVLSSFTRECGSSAEAVAIARTLGEEMEETLEHPTEYLGLADVFAVSGPAAVGAVLGRTGIPEWTSVQDVLGASEELDQTTIEQEVDEGAKNYIVELGYLEERADKPPRGLLAKTLIRTSAVDKVVALATEIASTPAFVDTIVGLGLNPEASRRLEFVCVHSVARTLDDALEGGEYSYLIRFIDPDDDEDWCIHDELLHPDDLLEHFDELENAQRDA